MKNQIFKITALILFITLTAFTCEKEVITPESTTCTGGYDITPGISVSSNTIPEGGGVNVSYTITNNGPCTSNGLIRAMFFKVPKGTHTLTSLPSGWSVVANNSAHIMVSSLDSLQSSQSVNFVLQYVHDGTDEDGVRSFMVLTDIGNDADSTNNQAQASVTIQ